MLSLRVVKRGVAYAGGTRSTEKINSKLTGQEKQRHVTTGKKVSTDEKERERSKCPASKAQKKEERGKTTC